MKLLGIIALLFISSLVQAQDQNIKKAVDQCCDCFTDGGKSNQDSLFIDCSVQAVSNNFLGLMSELSAKYAEDKNFSIEKEMIKHFKMCRSIRKYFIKKNREEKKNKKKD